MYCACTRHKTRITAWKSRVTLRHVRYCVQSIIAVLLKVDPPESLVALILGELTLVSVFHVPRSKSPNYTSMFSKRSRIGIIAGMLTVLNLTDTPFINTYFMLDINTKRRIVKQVKSYPLAYFAVALQPRSNADIKYEANTLNFHTYFFP